jgi:site-specific DNA-cytosine methylase
MSDVLGVEPQMINSALVSAQNRKRLYWTNIPYTVPEDRGILLTHVIPGAVAAGFHGRKNKSTGKYKSILNIDPTNHGKANCITTTPSTTCKYLKDGKLHNITASEAEILQTLKEGYTNLPGLCKTKRLKMIGNGWTPELIAHIFSGINIL